MPRAPPLGVSRRLVVSATFRLLGPIEISADGRRIALPGGHARSVLGLLAEGPTNRAIASWLVVTERTAEAHVSSIFGSLDLPDSPDHHRRVLAVLTLLRG